MIETDCETCRYSVPLWSAGWYACSNEECSFYDDVVKTPEDAKPTINTSYCADWEAK